MNFELIKDIDINNAKSWQDKIFLTFDLDWCSDEVLSYNLDIIEEYNITATFFITHETKLLKRMRKNPNIELGIHPNFNFLLSGDFRQGKNIEEIVEYYKSMVPDALSVRSHSMTQSSIILDCFEKFSLTHDSNTFIPFSSGMINTPYFHWTKKLTKIPYFWEDDVHCLYDWKWDVNNFIQYKGIRVFDFHPIHVFLNTERLDRYENARGDLHNFDVLKQHVNNTNYGTKNFLIDLIEKGLMA